MEFGSEIRERRIALKMSLRQLARMADISPTYLSHIEVNHVGPPSSEILVKIAESLSLDTNELVVKAGKWHEHAIKQLDHRPELSNLVRLAFAMNSDEVNRLIIQLTASNTRHGGAIE